MKKASKGGGLDDCSPANAGDPSDLKSDGTNKGPWEAAWDTVMTGSAAGRAKGIRLVCGLMQSECDVATVTRMCASSKCLLRCDYVDHNLKYNLCTLTFDETRGRGLSESALAGRGMERKPVLSRSSHLAGKHRSGSVTNCGRMQGAEGTGHI